MLMRKSTASLLIVLMVISTVYAYPIDGYLFSGIKRLLRLERVRDGMIKGELPPPGAMLPSDSIRLSLIDHDIGAFPSINTDLQQKINRLFPNLDESYSISAMDITDPENIVYAERQANRGFQPGSVGKLAVLSGLFCELESIYPDDFSQRITLLKEKKLRAGKWALPNIHTVPFFSPENNHLVKRLLVADDVFTLFEWVDHMVSVSSNGAASVVWREVILMRAFREDYASLTEEEAESYFRQTPKSALADIAIDVVNSPLRQLGITEEEWRLGTFFTRGGSDRIPPKGGSIGTPKGLIKWIWSLEHGAIVDQESSLEMKKLIYMTDRRIRYAANRKLDNAAVYFKSGSLYKCQQEPGFDCGKYKGNVFNYMNSVAIVEHPDGKKYAVVLMTNVLKKNSNADHNALAGRIDDILQKG